tara:strand:+ start:310 stop:654 length:345 start_codon:yes stop_codon:yes gene_type:complete
VLGFYLSEAQHIKKFGMDKKIEDIIETLKKEIISLKNIIDSKEAEIFTYKGVNKDHRKLNGQLRKEIDELKLANVQVVEKVKKEADRLMIEKIKKYEHKIRRLKNDAKDLLNYP